MWDKILQGMGIDPAQIKDGVENLKTGLLAFQQQLNRIEAQNVEILARQVEILAFHRVELQLKTDIGKAIANGEERRDDGGSSTGNGNGGDVSGNAAVASSEKA